MNILYVTHEKSFGGASKALVNLITKMDSKNNIYILVPFKKSKIIDEINLENVHFITSFYSWWQYPKNVSRTSKFIFKILYLFESFFMISIYRKLKKINFDIVHSNTSVIDVGVKISKKFNKPHIWHFREYTGKHLEFIRTRRKSYDYINKSNSYIIYISKAIEKFYTPYIKCKNIDVIYDGIDTHKDDVREYEDIEKVKFLFVGTLEENKGQALAIEACHHLKLNNIENYILLLVGGDPNGYSKILSKMIDDYNLKENVKYLGFSNSVDKLRKEANIELMCSPNEAFGLVTVEAMAMGNPVIGSNSGATPELVNDEVGALYEVKNAQDLAKKMSTFIKNKQLIKTKGIKAKKRVQRKFSIEEHTSKVLRLYKGVLK